MSTAISKAVLPGALPSTWAPASSPESIPSSWARPWRRASWDGSWSVSGTASTGSPHPERYPDGGLLPLGPQLIGNLDPAGAGVLGQSDRVDPFHVRTVDADGMVEEVDMSGELLNRLKAQNVDALISVIGGQGLSILYRLHRKGLNAVCVPRAIENDVAATLVSFGFNSALSFTIEMLDKARQAAQSARKIAVVEVLGAQAGWLALQAVSPRAPMRC